MVVGKIDSDIAVEEELGLDDIGEEEPEFETGKEFSLDKEEPETEEEPVPETEEEPEENFTRSGGRRASNLGRNREVASKEISQGNRLAESRLTEEAVNETPNVDDIANYIKGIVDYNVSITPTGKGFSSYTVNFLNTDGSIMYSVDVNDDAINDKASLINTLVIGLDRFYRGKTFADIIREDLLNELNKIHPVSKNVKAVNKEESKEIKTEEEPSSEDKSKINNVPNVVVSLNLKGEPQEISGGYDMVDINIVGTSKLTDTLRQAIRQGFGGIFRSEITDKIYSQDIPVSEGLWLTYINFNEDTNTLNFVIDGDTKKYPELSNYSVEAVTDEYIKDEEDRKYSAMVRDKYAEKEAEDKPEKDNKISSKEYEDIVKAIENAVNIDEIQDIIYAVNDGVVENEMQSMLDICEKDGDDLDTVKSLIINIFEDNVEIGE